MLAFHDAYHLSADGPASLRAAQMLMRRSPNAALRSPAVWGAFRYIGH
jgi:hypothetical protein